MEKLVGEPLQATLLFVKIGVTEKDPTRGVELLLLVTVKLLIFPVPEVVNPILWLSFTQLYEVPVPEYTIELVEVLLHKTWSEIGLMEGVGLTVIVKFTLLPVQVTPAFKNVGITEIVAFNEVEPLFAAMNGERLPVPEIARPIDGLLFVHE